MKVLCILVSKSREADGSTSTWKDSLMIDVDSSDQIKLEISYQLARREIKRHLHPGLYPTPFDVQLVCYLPENGRPHFDHRQPQGERRHGCVVMDTLH